MVGDSAEKRAESPLSPMGWGDREEVGRE